MTSQTAKYQLVTAESGDSSDMPTYTTAAMASVESALDRVLNQANAVAAGKVARTGDTMTGNLVVANPNNYSQVMLRSAAGNYWISTDPGSQGAMTFAVTDPNGGFQKGIAGFSGTRAGFSVPLAADAGLKGSFPAAPNSNGLMWLLCEPADGTVRSLTDTNFRLIVASIHQTSTRRLKTGITEGTAPDVTRLQPRAYQWADDAFKVSAPGERYGLIAEDVAAVDARLATVDADGEVAGLDDHALIAALIAKVTELQGRIEALEGGV